MLEIDGTDYVSDDVVIMAMTNLSKAGEMVTSLSILVANAMWKILYLEEDRECLFILGALPSELFS